MFNLIPFRVRLKKRKVQQVKIEGEKLDLKLNKIEEKRDLNKNKITTNIDLKIRKLNAQINQLKKDKEDKVGRVLDKAYLAIKKVENNNTNKVKSLKEKARRLDLLINADFQYLNYLEEPETIKQMRRLMEDK